ncbi:uncharacterized protein LOC113849419 isoform X2 [Abrus precatorius]|uniref:Uncharacterized protein LOC113849419 isoform X2 n=1 Tax=Abrus precatorius TaxID=3816 RepID=A0A8B8JWU5_ABRPR|nr:uncharacterized protein LOC113849419 isoform X2 [Abrus precatorius]
MQMAILLRGGVLGDSCFRLCSLTSTSVSLHVSQNVVLPTSPSSSSSSSSSSPILPLIASKFKMASRNRIICSAVQESSTSTAATAETKEEEVKEAPKAAPAKKPPAKAPAKPLPQLMEEEVIPSLKAIFEAQEDFSNIELVFKDNKLEGSFLKEGNPYSFWAFFPTGNVIAASFCSCLEQVQRGFLCHRITRGQALLNHF